MEPTIRELETIFQELESKAQLYSDDSETKVGAKILGSSHKEFNTFIEGAKNLPNTRPEKYQYIIHAEANLVNWAARTGYRLQDRIVVCTLSPCQSCIRTIFQAGIREIYYKDIYRNHNPEMRDIKVIEKEYGPYIKMTLSNHE